MVKPESRIKKFLDPNPIGTGYLYDSKSAGKYSADNPDWHIDTDSEFHDWCRVRSALEHENHLSYERGRMLTAVQAFLFAAYFLIYTGHPSADSIHIELVLYAICLLSILVAYFLFLGMRTARVQHTRLERWWSSRIGGRKSKKPKKFRRLRHPPPCGTDPGGVWILPYLRYHHFPLFFLVAWIFMLFFTWLDPDDIKSFTSTIETQVVIKTGEILDCEFRFLSDMTLHSFECK